jgi:hypothetical protein
VQTSNRRRPSAALLLSIAALFISLGGTAIAAGGLISGSRLRNGSVAGIKLKAHTITGNQINMAKLGTVPSATSAATAGTASHANTAAMAETANHATNADAAVAAQAANSASTFGGLTAAQYLHADLYNGTQDTPHYNSGINETTGALSTPTLAAGSYLVIAHATIQNTGVAAFYTCSFGNASAGSNDSVTMTLSTNQTYDFPLIVAYTSDSGGADTLSCAAQGNDPYDMTAEIAVVRLGSESAGGTLTAS